MVGGSNANGLASIRVYLKHFIQWPVSEPRKVLYKYPWRSRIHTMALKAVIYLLYLITSKKIKLLTLKKIIKWKFSLVLSYMHLAIWCVFCMNGLLASVWCIQFILTKLPVKRYTDTYTFTKLICLRQFVSVCEWSPILVLMQFTACITVSPRQLYNELLFLCDKCSFTCTIYMDICQSRMFQVEYIHCAIKRIKSVLVEET